MGAKDAIRELLAPRGLQPGGRIPAEQELVALLGVHRSTVREALRALEHEGLLATRRGVGTFLADPTPLVRLDQVHVETKKRPAFFSCSYWRTDHFAFRVLRRVQK